jgi:hypothetical protein
MIEDFLKYLRKVEPIRNNRIARPNLQTLLRYSQQVVETALKIKIRERNNQCERSIY